MVSFIGSNNRETLLGVIEEIDREIKSEGRKAGGAKLKRDQYAAAYAVAKLGTLRWIFEDAAKNGPTPDLSRLSEMRLELTPESRVALAAARGIDIGPPLERQSADDIANDLLSRVNLDTLLTPQQQYARDHEDGAHGPEIMEGCAACETIGACSFCGAPRNEDGSCSVEIDDDCDLSTAIVGALEAKVQEFGQQAGIKVEITPSNDGSSFVLFDGMQVGSRRTRAQALTSALERLSVRLRGMLAGSPNVTFGICTDQRHVKEENQPPKVVYFNGDVWQCETHKGLVGGVILEDSPIPTSPALDAKAQAGDGNEPMICENCELPIKDEDGYRHEGLGVVHKYCPDPDEDDEGTA